MNPKNRAVFLDRDGVINRMFIRDGRPYPPATMDDLEIYPGVADAIHALRGAGFKIIVVTNQPDVATGVQKREVVEMMHGRISRELPIDDILVCYHSDQDRCECRKPKPGMLLAGALEWSLDLKKSYMVGDRWRDIEAGKAAGCRTILIDHGGYAEKKPETPWAVAASMLEASRIILSDRPA